LSLQEFTDLIEYLVTLKQPVNALTSHRGMPETIPQLTRPITLRPFLSEELRVPPVSGGAAGRMAGHLVDGSSANRKLLQGIFMLKA